MYSETATENKAVVEIKVVVDRRKNGFEPLKGDLCEPNGTGGIEGDHKKLNENYTHFNSKFQVIALPWSLQW